MPELYIYKQRTQQNKNFVAFEGDICYNKVKISDFMMSHDATDLFCATICLYMVKYIIYNGFSLIPSGVILMRKLTFVLLILIILFSGCTATDSTGITSATETSVPVTTDSATESTVPVTTQETPLPTETTTPPTTAPLYDELEISAGSYLMNHTSNSFTEQMNYWLFVPKNAHSEMPLVIFLHGLGEVGKTSELENFGMIEKAREFYGDEYPFIAINPCLPDGSWILGNYPALLKDLIDTVVSKYKINPDKIILTGHSLGSIGTWYMISRYGDYFSAAVPISCGCDAILNYENMAKVSFWPFVGDSDEYEIRYRAGMERIVGELNKRGCDIELTVLKGQHHGQTKTDAFTIDVFEWMLSK